MAEAARAGLAAVAVTDHDVTFGAAEAVAHGDELGVEVVPGVEVSAEWKPGQMHIVGLWIDPGDPELTEWLDAILGGRNARNTRIVARLRELGVDIELAEVEAVAGDGAVGRPHIAQVLVAKGAVGSRQEAFDRYLAKGAPAYFDRLRATPEEAIAHLHAAGGLAVLAHPHYCGARDAGQLSEWVGTLADAGLDGIEVRYSTFTAADRRVAEQLARRYDLLPSGGSDFHGAAKPDIALGSGRGDLEVPAAWLESLRAARTAAPPPPPDPMVPADNLTWHAGAVTAADRERLLGQRGCVVWLTGLSGSGKSTLARAVEERLVAGGRLAYVLDGDNLRHGLNADLAFSPADRSREHPPRRAGGGAARRRRSGGPDRSSSRPTAPTARWPAGGAASGRFFEVFVDAPVAVCEERDPKGLYASARSGEIAEFTGVSAPYEPPERPDLVVATAGSDRRRRRRRHRRAARAPRHARRAPRPGRRRRDRRLMSHLEQLEAESIHILREVAADSSGR